MTKYCELQASFKRDCRFLPIYHSNVKLSLFSPLPIHVRVVEAAVTVCVEGSVVEMTGKIHG